MSLARYHATSEIKTAHGNGAFHSEEETIEQILKKENFAASIFCWLKADTLTQALNLSFTKDVVGIVATLAKVDSDDLIRSVYLFFQLF